MLDELDALFLLLPKFQVPVNGGGNQELGPVANVPKNVRRH